MARNEQLIRQHKIIQVLERRRYGASLEDLRDTVVDELGLEAGEGLALGGPRCSGADSVLDARLPMPEEVVLP